MEYREGLELEKKAVEERFLKEKADTITELEDLLGRVKKADPRWVNVYYERLRNKTLNALENLGRAAAIVDVVSTNIKMFDDASDKAAKEQKAAKPQNQLAFGAAPVDWSNVEQVLNEK